MPMMPKWVHLPVNAAKAWQADNAFKHSAAVSFYTLFSLAPVAVIAITLMSLFLGSEVATRQFSTQVSELVGPASAEMIRTAAAAAIKLQTQNHFSAALGLGILLIGATSVFAQLQDSVNEIWGVRAQPGRRGIIVVLVRRLISFAMVLTLGFLLLVSLVLTTVLSAALGTIHGRMDTTPWLLHSVDFGVTLVVITILFALLFKVMPDVRQRWRDIWPGAILTAALFGLGRYGIALYLSHSTVASIYGTAASLVAVLVWVYYSCSIFFFGVEFTRAQHLAHHRALHPKSKAVRASR
jgi:membrane protein